MSAPITGTVTRVVSERGFAFMKPDDGDEQVFLHATVMPDEFYNLAPGARVACEAVDTERGPRASRAWVIEG